jgi:hypothetical protein
VLLQFGAGLGGNRVVDEIVEKSEKLRAGHLSFLVSPTLFSLGLVTLGAFFLRK